MWKQFTHLLFFLLSSLCSALYDGGDSNVITFSSKASFREEVLKSDGVWLVQFFAPWCGHCKQFAPAYKEIANILKGVVSVGAIDATDDQFNRIKTDYGVNGFPTLKFFSADKKYPVDVKNRDPNSIINQALEEIQNILQSRAKGTPGSSSAGGGNKNKAGSSSKVQSITEGTFTDKVLNNSEVSMIAFIAPWCGHCKNLSPELEEAALKLDGTGAFIGTVDATVEERLAGEYNVKGFPTIKIFPGGKGKTSSDAYDYEGGRTAENIIHTLLEEVDRSGIPKEIPELTNNELFEEECVRNGRICVLFAMPHILDTGADGRNKYINIMKESAKAVRGMSFSFLWYDGTSQPELGEALELTFGYPAVAAVAVDKGVYTVHRGSFTEKNIRKFLMGITTGRTQTFKMKNGNTLPKVVNVEPWDGNDGEAYEDIPLDDIMGDDEF